MPFYIPLDNDLVQMETSSVNKSNGGLYINYRAGS